MLALSLLLVAVISFKYMKRKVVLASLIVLSLGVFSLEKFYLAKQLSAVTLIETEVFEGPSGVFASARVIPAGLKVIFNKKYQDWVFIIHPERMTGWVKSKDIGIL
jgi:hypothetical protein